MALLRDRAPYVLRAVDLIGYFRLAARARRSILADRMVCRVTDGGPSRAQPQRCLPHLLSNQNYP